MISVYSHVKTPLSHDLHGALPLQLSDNFFVQEKTESAGSESPEEADEKVEPMIPTSPGGLVGMFQCMDGIDALRHRRGYSLGPEYQTRRK